MYLHYLDSVYFKIRRYRKENVTKYSMHVEKFKDVIAVLLLGRRSKGYC